VRRSNKNARQGMNFFKKNIDYSDSYFLMVKN